MAISNDLTTLDFDSIKNNLKRYLKDQDVFKDYDFEASNINVLLDVLAYNTNLNAFYLNMIANEMFLDSALMRDSIISHAKELNYLPRSFRSATARVNITLSDTSAQNAQITIPRGTTFTGTLDNRNFTFSTSENIQARSVGNNLFVANNVVLAEGDYVQDSYVTDSTENPRFIITNKTVDTNSIRVTVIEDNGENVLTYERKDSLFDLGASSQIFFVEPAVNDTYEVIFGDGVIGRPPKSDSIVLLEYRICNGELPNGIRKFSADDDIGTATVTRIDLVVDEETKEQTPASGGSIPESLDSIKFNAPRAFSTQERVVTAQDYATLLKANFSEINDVVAFGGEQFKPPRYGSVIIAVDLKNTDELPPILRDKFLDFIEPRAPLSITPYFVQAEYSYITVNTKVRYDTSQTSLGVDDINGFVIAAIQNYNFNNIEGFNKTLRYSKLVAAIDAASNAIISNDTDLQVTKYIPLNLTERQNYRLDFGMALVNDIGQKIGEHSASQRSVVETNGFIFNGQNCLIEDNGLGELIIVTNSDPHVQLTKVGTVDYETGELLFDDFFVKPSEGFLKVSVTPRDRDVSADRTTILRVLDSDINVTVEPI